MDRHQSLEILDEMQVTARKGHERLQRTLDQVRCEGPILLPVVPSGADLQVAGSRGRTINHAVYSFS